MRSVLCAVALLISASLHADIFVPPSPRPVFPDDYKPAQCAPTACESFDSDGFRSAAFRFLGLSLDAQWFDKHSDEMKKVVLAFCRKRNTCLATPGDVNMFCDDLITPSMRDICDTMYPREKNAKDWEQCKEWIETFALGLTQRSLPIWNEAQECAKPFAAMHLTQPDVWIAPEKFPADYEGYLTFFAIDPDTHVPIFGHIIWNDQIVFAPSNPTGETATYYPFKGPFKLARVSNADGHTDLVPPTVTIKYDYYPTQQFRLPMIVPKMVVKLERDPAWSKSGKHPFKVTATDAATGTPVEASVMIGEVAVGETNMPLTFERRKGEKLQDIWVTSLFDRYSDVVLAKAEK